MVDWSSPENLAKFAVYSVKITFVIAGWYYWEFLTSLDFEWKYITRKKTFRWPIISYFGARYSILITITTLMIAANVTSEINCGALITISGLTGQATTGFTSLIFATRTMVIWDFELYIVIPLVLALLGQWVVIIMGGIYHAVWIPGVGCSPTPISHPAIVATLIYALALDFVVAALAVYKLTVGKRKRSHVVDLMLKDGLLYYFVAFIADVPAVIAISLSTNSLVVNMFNVPASVAYTVAATRAVRRLANFQNTQASVFSSSRSGASSRGTANPFTMPIPPTLSSLSANNVKHNEIHVQMETVRHHSSDTHNAEPKINHDIEYQSIMPDVPGRR